MASIGLRPRRRRRAAIASRSTLPVAVFSTKRACPSCGTQLPRARPAPLLVQLASTAGARPASAPASSSRGFDEAQTGEEIWWNEWWDGDAEPCPACAGQRLNPVALTVRFRGRSIAELDRAAGRARSQAFFRELALAGREAEIARDIVAELASRLAFLDEVGLGYLALDRAAPTLSGGEAQRIRLAAQLGSNLHGVCYILDEPTIGLHPRDNRVLLDTLEKLEAKGNTLLVVEHDEETIRRAAPRHRPRPGRRQPRRPRGRGGRRRGADADPRVGHRPLPRRAAAPSAAPASPGRPRHAVDRRRVPRDCTT